MGLYDSAHVLGFACQDPDCRHIAAGETEIQFHPDAFKGYEIGWNDVVRLGETSKLPKAPLLEFHGYANCEACKTLLQCWVRFERGVFTAWDHWVPDVTKLAERPRPKSTRKYERRLAARAEHARRAQARIDSSIGEPFWSVMGMIIGDEIRTRLQEPSRLRQILRTRALPFNVIGNYVKTEGRWGRNTNPMPGITDAVAKRPAQARHPPAGAAGWETGGDRPAQALNLPRGMSFDSGFPRE